MKHILHDIKTASSVFGEIRKARKDGSEVEIKHSKQLPFINSGPSFLDTVEGCVLININEEIFEKARKTFHGFKYEEKRMICLSPKDGEFVRRIKFWKAALKSVMSEKEYRVAIGALLHWYVHIKQF